MPLIVSILTRIGRTPANWGEPCARQPRRAQEPKVRVRTLCVMDVPTGPDARPSRDEPEPCRCSRGELREGALGAARRAARLSSPVAGWSKVVPSPGSAQERLHHHRSALSGSIITDHHHRSPSLPKSGSTITDHHHHSAVLRVSRRGSGKEG